MKNQTKIERAINYEIIFKLDLQSFTGNGEVPKSGRKTIYNQSILWFLQCNTFLGHA